MKKANILIIDPHRPEFFWEPISIHLANMSGWVVDICKDLPLDHHHYDVILCVYMSDQLRNIVNNSARMKIIGISMGTDVCVNAYKGVDSRRLTAAIAFNNHHENMLKKELPFTKIKRLVWPCDDTRLIYKERALPAEPTESIRLLNIALHQYSKGLDNLLQMLEDAASDFVIKPELYCIGSMGPFLDYNQYLNYYAQWFTSEKAKNFKFMFQGESHPKQIDHLIESINPHAYITASQGEQGATTVAEALCKGLKVFVQDHPFADGLYLDFVKKDDKGNTWLDYEAASKCGLYFYNTASELKIQLRRAFDSDKYESSIYREYGLKSFGMSIFIKQLIEVIKEVSNGSIV